MATRRSESNIVIDVTHDYILSLDKNNLPSVSEIANELVEQTQDAIEFENAARPKEMKITIPKRLYPYQVAQLILNFHQVHRVACAGIEAESTYDLLAMYESEGPNAGTYIANELMFESLIHQYNPLFSSREITDVLNILRYSTKRIIRSSDPNKIAVNNGIFDFQKKELLPFSPEFVFLSKSHVDYIPNAANPVIHNDDDGTDWDVESWMSDLSDDPEIVELLWQILGAIIRPFVPWNKSAWFYSTSGNNGKGTLCELMRNLCGPGTYASIPLSDFGIDFRLEPLIRATAIIVDENDVGTFVDKAANLKAIITNDVIQITRKFKMAVSYQFYGFMVQCLNEMPRIKDKSDSFYRRQLFVPFEKCFTGHERKYIKNDYLKRPDVLQYVLYKVLNMNYYSLSEPAACVMALNEYKGFNDPVREFAMEILPQCQWDLLPFKFLYDLYTAWFKQNNPSGKPQGRNTFIADVIDLLPNLPDWQCLGRTTAIRPGSRMDVPEPLILEYDLKDWMNPVYTGNDPNRRCMPMIKSTYNGLIRASNTTQTNSDDNDEPAFDS